MSFWSSTACSRGPHGRRRAVHHHRQGARGDSPLTAAAGRRSRRAGWRAARHRPARRPDGLSARSARPGVSAVAGRPAGATPSAGGHDVSRAKLLAAVRIAGTAALVTTFLVAGAGLVSQATQAPSVPTELWHGLGWALG